MMQYEHIESGHTTRVTITRGTVGWELREEHDSQIVRTSRYTDWHRVERAMHVFELAHPAARRLRSSEDVGSGDHSTNR